MNALENGRHIGRLELVVDVASSHEERLHVTNLTPAGIERQADSVRH
jgi:hypothetical protein